MALRAGYYGLKKKLLNKVKALPGIKSIGSGLSLNPTTGELTATGTTLPIEPNPEGAATEDLTKLLVGETIYEVNDNTKCYQTDDATESAIADADYVPFLDSSAASGSGAPRKSTWSNFKNKILNKSYLTDDTTETNFDDDDYIPFYDTSAASGDGAPRKSTWSNFKTKLKAVFDVLYMTWEANNVLGAKNLLNPAGYRSVGVASEDYTINSDGSVTFNGSTGSLINFFSFAQRALNTLKLEPNKSYKLSIKNGNNNIALQVGYTHPTTGNFVNVAQSSYGETELEFQTPAESAGMGWTAQLIYSEQTTLTNYTVYPMIRISEDIDDTYFPYTMTNRDLTMKTQGIIDAATNAVDFAAFKTAIGNL